jgi:PAS domain S-box-containing protein
MTESLITEQKNAMLAAIIANSDDTIISKTLDGMITSWNPAAEKMFGYNEAEAIGQHISLIIPPDRLDEESFIIGQIKQGKKIDHFETIRIAKNGNLVPISLSVSPIPNSDGIIIGASKIARDLTYRKMADEKQAVLAAIIATSDDAIVSKTLEGIITSWNKAAMQMFGYTEIEVVGQHISLIIPAERMEEESYIISEISKGNKIDHFHTFRKAKDGRLIPISVSVSPIMNESGKIIGASKIARDISEQLSLQEEKARLYNQIKALNDKKDEFIGLASHELKTPLTSISGYLQIMDKIVKEEKAKQFLAKTLQQVKKLSALVNDLLDVSKIEAGKLSLSVEQFNIRDITDDAIELLAHSYPQFELKLHTDIDKLIISGDPHRIEQVIINLLTNAIRYSPGSSLIELFLNQDGANVTLGIKDYGIGIAEDKIKDIFSRFYRVDDLNPNISGLGIGLYLSQEIIKRHNGTIWADSKFGEGSTFWFSLPL